MSPDGGLMMLMRTIARGERAQASNLLAAAPELALARAGAAEQCVLIVGLLRAAGGA